MRAMVVREYGTAPVVCEVADPAGPAADVLAASLNPVDMAVAAGLNRFRRPELPLVLGLDGVARRAGREPGRRARHLRGGRLDRARGDRSAAAR